MKKILLISLLFFMLFANAQSNHKMKSDTIILSSNIKLFQKKDRIGNQTRWKLFLQNKKENKVILLDSFEVVHPDANAIVSSDNTILEIPKLLSAIKDESSIYTFIFKEYALWLYKYHFTDGERNESKRIKIFNMLPGSVDNFGDAYFNISHYKVVIDDYFKISHNRVIGKVEMLTRFDKDSFTLKKIFFLEKIKTIKDDNELFSALDLDKNSDKVSAEIKKVLLENKFLDKYNSFKYLGNIDISDFKDDEKYKLRTTGMTYFLYQNESKTKIIRYNNYDNKWLNGCCA